MTLLRTATLATALAACARDPLATNCARAGTQAAFVDPRLGTDDDAHGAAPGACAFRSISFALTRATATINLDGSATYDAATETFPLVLTGVQALDGDPTGTGTRAKLVGIGPVGNDTPPIGQAYAALALAGDANKLTNIDVSVPSAGLGPNMNACVAVLTSGAHVVDHSALHDCGLGVYSVGVFFSGTSGASVTRSTIAGVQNCANTLGSDVTIETTSCSAAGYYVSICGSGLAGCGNSNDAAALGLCRDCACPPTFTAACM